MKNRFIALFLLLTVFLTGCGKTEVQTEKQTETADQVEAAEPAEESLYPEDQKSCVIQEDEKYIYVCGPFRIMKIDKETGESGILWENAELWEENKLYLYFQGGGLLAGDKIYFVEQSAYGETALSVIQTDGTGHEKIKMLTGRGIMLLQDGTLYVRDREEVTCYRVYADGTLSEAVNPEELENLYRFPKEYSNTRYQDNGYRTLFVAETMKKLGCAILEKGHKPVKVFPETGEAFDISQFGNTLEAFNSRYLLISSYDRGSYLVNAETLEGREFADCSGLDVITMDEDYVYTESKVTEDGKVQHVYEKISVETGERSVICKRDQSKVWKHDIMDTVVKNGYLYYVKEVDHDLYLVRRNVKDPSKEEILGEALYDSGISEVGTIEVYYENTGRTGRFRGGSEEVVELKIEIDLKWLQVDDRFPGAAKINECLAKDQRQNIAYEKGWLDDLITEAGEKESEEEINEEEDLTFHFSYISEFSEISYFDGHYISFYQSEDDYQGGAHGMLYRIGYTFDLQTGARLVLEDVIADNEEELKDIVAGYFEKAIQENPEPGYYWSDALDTVREWTDLESSFYLTEKGIRIYFAPYILAPFAAGFQEVTIPYEEFKMKIPVGNVQEGERE